jgi:hypothetical protein
MITLYTVKPEHLLRDAEQIERNAIDSLRAWILLGQTSRYLETMNTARALRRAASERNVSTRREILRNAGFTVLTPRAARGAA